MTKERLRSRSFVIPEAAQRLSGIQLGGGTVTCYTHIMRTIVVVPAYNEAARIGETVWAVLGLDCHPDVVVIDDGSDDATADAAQFAGATVLRHSVNRGQGAALQTGTEWALAHDADCIVHFDADGQFDAADISRAVQLIQERGVGIVLGSRLFHVSLREASVSERRSNLIRLLRPFWPRNDNRIPATKRYIILPIARLVNWAFTGVWLTDAHNGFRVFSRRAAEQIEITHDRMAHNTEIVAQIRERGISFAEMPVSVRYHRYGQGVGGGVKIVADLLMGWFL